MLSKQKFVNLLNVFVKNSGSNRCVLNTLWAPRQTQFIDRSSLRSNDRMCVCICYKVDKRVFQCQLQSLASTIFLTQVLITVDS